MNPRRPLALWLGMTWWPLTQRFKTVSPKVEIWIFILLTNESQSQPITSHKQKGTMKLAGYNIRIIMTWNTKFGLELDLGQALRPTFDLQSNDLWQTNACFISKVWVLSRHILDTSTFAVISVSVSILKSTCWSKFCLCVNTWIDLTKLCLSS